MTLGTLSWGHVGTSLGAKRFKMAPGQARDAREGGGRRHPWSVSDSVLVHVVGDWEFRATRVPRNWAPQRSVLWGK